MDQKASLLAILEELFGIFDAAEDLHAYVRSPEYDESLTEDLLALFESEIAAVADDEKKSRLLAGIERLRAMRLREQSESVQEREEAGAVLELY